MSYFPAPYFTRNLPTLLVAALLALAFASPSLAAEDPADPNAPRGAAVTVLTAKKSCFSDIVAVSGIIQPREDGETLVRPERQGLKVSEILAEPGDTVTAGQTLVRLTLPEGGLQVLQAPVAGLISNSTAVIGATASGRGEALFSIIAGSQFDLVGLSPTQDIAKLKVGQPVRIKIVGGGEVEGRLRRVAPMVEANQLGRVLITITGSQRLLVNSSGRAMITTGKSCGNVSVPLTAVLYSPAGTVVQVVGKRQRVETRQVGVGLMSAGQVEISSGLEEGDMVVARAGALLREGDPVRPVTADGR
jgi:HlyD family secretion protein